MINALCVICTEYVSITQILFPRCGHPLCSTCLSEAPFNPVGTFPCPICREPMQRHEPHKIFPQLSRSSAQEDAARIASRMGQINCDAQTSSFKTGARKLRNIQTKVALTPAESKFLLDTATKMEGVMADMSEKITDTSRQLTSLTSALQVLQGEKAQLEEAYAAVHRDARLYARTKEKNRALTQEVQRLQRLLDRSEYERSQVQQQYETAVTERNTLKVQVRLEKTRQKALVKAKLQTKRKRPAEAEPEGDPEDSIIIAPSHPPS